MNPANCPIDLEASDRNLMNQVIEFYQHRLLEHPKAQQYLRNRGILDREALTTHRLGLADRELARALPSTRLASGRQIRQRLMDLGIYRRATGHGQFNGCIVFPVTDPAGNVREIYGRKINDNLRKGTEYHVHLPFEDRPFDDRGFWNEAALAVHGSIILCQSIIDAMTFWCAGQQNVTAIGRQVGEQGGLSEYQLEAFAKNRTQTVWLALDRSQQGAASAAQIGKALLETGIDVYRIDFPLGQDANAYLVGSRTVGKGQPARPSLDALIRTASWVGNGVKSEVESCQTKSDEALSAASETPTDADLSANSSLGATTEPETSPQPTVKQQEIGFQFGDRDYRVRGLEKNHSYATLRVNLLARRGEGFHVDTFDLYQSRPRANFIKLALQELVTDEQVIKRDLGQILLQLEQLQDQQIQSLLKQNQPTEVELDPAAKADALQLLKDKDLLNRILTDFDSCGVVGEETNKLIGYLATVSRKLNDPLAVLIQSSSAAGKSSLMDAVLAFVPAEDKVTYSAMTGQSLYYMGDGDLKHKILAISEEEGVRQASYALKLLQSEGSLRIASTGKDPQTGRMETQQYTVEGPVMLFLTTTRYDVDEELQNRCLTLSVCEDRAQTKAIHKIQRKRETLDGWLEDPHRVAIQTVHQNAQRLLKPLIVVNNFAEELKFRSDRTRTRRDHAKYLTLIRVIALLHQYQREIKTVDHNGEQIKYIEVTRHDIAKADELAAAIMARSYEELPERTQFVLGQIHELLVKTCTDQAIQSKDFRFTRRELRELTGTGNTQLKIHLDRLEDLEYIVRLKRTGSNPTIVYAVIDIDANDPPYDWSLTGDEGLLRGACGATPENEKQVTTPEQNGQLVSVG